MLQPNWSSKSTSGSLPLQDQAAQIDGGRVDRLGARVIEARPAPAHVAGLQAPRDELVGLDPQVDAAEGEADAPRAVDLLGGARQALVHRRTRPSPELGRPGGAGPGLLQLLRVSLRSFFPFALRLRAVATRLVLVGPRRIVGALHPARRRELEDVAGSEVLVMEAGFGDPSLPSLLVDFDLDWQFESETVNGQPLQGSTPDIGFSNVKLNTGTLISGVLDRVTDILAPIQPVVDRAEGETGVAVAAGCLSPLTFRRHGATHEVNTSDDEKNRPQVDRVDIDESEVVGDPPAAEEDEEGAADPGAGARRIDHLGETEDDEDERPVVPQAAGVHDVEVVEREEHADQDHGEAEHQPRGESKSRLFFCHMLSSGLTGGASGSSRSAGRARGVAMAR